MTSFIYLVLGFTALDVIRDLLELGTRRTIERSPGLLAWNVALNVALIVLGVLALKGTP